MADDLTRFEQWAAPLIAALSDAQCRRLASDIGRQLKRSTSRRIAQQANLDGSPYEPRKPRLRNQRDSIRREAMFKKIRSPKYLLLRTSAEGIALGYLGRLARIARVHQEGLTDKPQPGGPDVTYPERHLIGWTDDDADMVRDTIMRHLEKSTSS